MSSADLFVRKSHSTVDDKKEEEDLFVLIVILHFRSHFIEKMTVKPRVKPEESEEDPVENMLKKTGCIELHYKVQVRLCYV